MFSATASIRANTIIAFVLLTGCPAMPEAPQFDATASADAAPDAPLIDGGLDVGSEPDAPATDGRADAERADAGPCATPDSDGDGVAALVCDGLDCDDTDPSVRPGGVELCDAGDRDEDCNPETTGEDRDGDFFMDLVCCNVLLDGSRACGTDCDDSDAAIHPGVFDICDGVDTDCDEAVDEVSAQPFYRDDDGDGFGGATLPTWACSAPPGYGLPGDCDDTRPAVYPSATELCADGLDNNCNFLIDEADRLFYLDADGDGFGDYSSRMRTASCTPPTGHVTNGRDCDDTRGSINPAAVEQCGDGIDNDCDTAIDEAGCIA